MKKQKKSIKEARIEVLSKRIRQGKRAMRSHDNRQFRILLVCLESVYLSGWKLSGAPQENAFVWDDSTYCPKESFASAPKDIRNS